MTIFECRGCGRLYKSNVEPDVCCCGRPSKDDALPAWRRHDDADDLF